MAAPTSNPRMAYFQVIEAVISSLKDELELAGADTVFLADLKRVFITIKTFTYLAGRLCWMLCLRFLLSFLRLGTPHFFVTRSPSLTETTWVFKDLGDKTA
jgi:hypothetical protein